MERASDTGMADTVTNWEKERLTIVGTSCSGKTTLARQLSLALGTPCIELDAIHWRPAWQPRPDEEFRLLVSEVVSGERWVIDGNYRQVRDIVWARATILIWLNYPFRVVIWRALRRAVKRAATQEELFSGNRESFRKSFFSRESIILWVMSSYRRLRRNYRRLLDNGEYPHLRVIELRYPAQAEALIASVGRVPSGESNNPSGRY